MKQSSLPAALLLAFLSIPFLFLHLMAYLAVFVMRIFKILTILPLIGIAKVFVGIAENTKSRFVKKIFLFFLKPLLSWFKRELRKEVKTMV